LIKALTPSASKATTDIDHQDIITTLLSKIIANGNGGQSSNSSSLENEISSILSRTKNKRTRIDDGIYEITKKLKINESVEKSQTSLRKDSDTQLVSTSNGDISKPEQTKVYDKEINSDNIPDNVTSQSTATPMVDDDENSENYSSAIYSTPSLGKFMQCDTCLGSGFLPIPASAGLRNTQGDPKIHSTPDALDSSPNALALLDIDKTCFPIDTPKRSSSDGAQSKEGRVEENDSDFKEAEKCSFSWSDQIRVAEKKWDIGHDESQTYPQRIDAIEKKWLLYNKIFKNSTCFGTSSGRDSSTILEGIKDIECIWGFSSPGGLDFAQRAKMIEEITMKYSRRLDRCL